MHSGHAARYPLRHAWGLEIDAEDPYGVGPEAALRAHLPSALSRALDGARSRIPVPRGPTEPLRSAMLAPALASAKTPLPFPLLSQYVRYWREGVRTDYEDDVRALGILAGEAVLAALATGEERWIDRAADALLLLCELSTWCWVAHEQSHELRGWVLPDPGAPVVDLGAAQTLQVIAWADLALGAELDARVPGLRERLRHEADRRVFDPYLSRRDWHWLHGTAHNWTGWIHQHLIAGALFLMDGESQRERRDAILALSIAQLDRYLASFPADGGIDEGFSYFWNGASRLLEAIDLLGTASGGWLDPTPIAQLPVVGELLRFPQRMDLGGGWFVNVADGPARPLADQPWDVLHRWGRHLGASDVQEQAIAHRGEGTPVPTRSELGLGRVLTAYADHSWRDAAAPTGRAPSAVSTWLSDVQLLVARERDEDFSGLVLAAKGGHNAEAHNHLDVGSYMVALDSLPVVIDLGQPTYTASTFTDRRYEIWTMTSSWHNLPLPGGVEQGVGEEYRAEVLDAPRPGGDPGAEPTSVTFDLTAAYPPEAGVRSLRRRAALHRGEGEDGTAKVRIDDTWQVAPGAGGIVAHHVIAGEILDHRDGSLRVRTRAGAVAELVWTPEVGRGILERREVADPLLEQSWGKTVHRLRLPLRLPLSPRTAARTGAGQFALTVRAVR